MSGIYDFSSNLNYNSSKIAFSKLVKSSTQDGQVLFTGEDGYWDTTNDDTAKYANAAKEIDELLNLTVSTVVQSGSSFITSDYNIGEDFLDNLDIKYTDITDGSPDIESSLAFSIILSNTSTNFETIVTAGLDNLDDDGNSLDDEASTVISAIDVNGNGEIDVNEFMGVLSALDTDQDGVVTAEEREQLNETSFQETLSQKISDFISGNNLSEYTNDYRDSLDTDGSGYVDLSEIEGKEVASGTKKTTLAERLEELIADDKRKHRIKEFMKDILKDTKAFFNSYDTGE